MLSIFVHLHLFEGFVHPAANFRWLHAEILQGEGHVLFYNSGDDLVVRILEHHAHVLPDFKELLFVGSVDAVDEDLSVVGRSTALKCFASVDLPEPLWPKTATNSPARLWVQVLEDGNAAAALPRPHVFKKEPFGPDISFHNVLSGATPACKNNPFSHVSGFVSIYSHIFWYSRSFRRMRSCKDFCQNEKPICLVTAPFIWFTTVDIVGAAWRAVICCNIKIKWI